MEVQVPPLAIDTGSNGIAVRDILPDRPRFGKVYYIRGDGLYFFEGDEWLKISTTAV